MKIIIGCSLSIFLHNEITAQTIVTGRITDSSGKALAGANIFLEGTYDGVSSNSEGDFSLSTGETGTHILCIDFIGFETTKKELILNGTPEHLPTIKLKETFNELTAVTISAGTFEAGDKKKSISFSTGDMVTTAGAAGDVYGALQALPGTTTVGESGKLFVKGGDSRESKTFIDGTLVYVPYSSSSPNNSVRGRFSPFMFSGTMFSTGGYSAEYGQALSSVLALQTNALPVQDQMNISLLSVGAELGGTKTWDRASVTTSINYENLMPYMKVVPQYRDWNKEPQSLKGDLSFRLKTGKSGMLKIYANASKSSLSTFETNLNKPGFTSKFNLINDNFFMNGSWIGEVVKNWILTTGFSFTDNTDKVALDSIRYREHLRGTHAKVTMKHRLNEKTKIVAGAELFSKNYSMDIPSIENPGTNGFLTHTMAGFIEAEIYASSRFITRIGTRYEYSDYLKKASLAPRISTAYKMTKFGQVSFSYGWFFQDPEDEFLLYSDSFTFERADHFTLNYIWEANQRVLRTEAYYKDYKNLVKYETGENREYDFINNTGYGSSYGIDLFWRDRKSLKSAEYWISYSFIESLRNYHNFPYEAVPNFTSKHNLTLVYKHWLARLRSQVGGTYRLSSPRVYNNPNSTAFNSERTIPYQSLDVNWSYLHRQNVIFYFSVSNLPGFKQEFGHEYASVPDNEGYYQSAPKLPGAKRFFIIGCFITLSKSGDINQLNKIN